MTGKDPVFLIQTRDYIKVLSRIVKNLEAAKPKDRMEYAVEIARCLNGALMSMKGWECWIGNLERLNALTIDDFKDVYPKMRKAIIDLLKVDLEITKKKTLEATIKYNKRKKQKKEKPKEKETYIA